MDDKAGEPQSRAALRLDIDAMIRVRVIQPGAHVGSEIRFQFYGDELNIQFEALAGDPWNSWIRLRYVISDYWTGEQHEIDDKIYLAASLRYLPGKVGQAISYRPYQAVGIGWNE